MTTAVAKPRILNRYAEDELRASLSSCPVRPFLATLNRSSRSDTELNIHVSRKAANSPPRRMRHDISNQISSLALGLPVRIKFHRCGALDKPRSLEQFLMRFGQGEWVYDPTGVFEEAERLVSFAHRLRRQIAGKLKGIYWSSRWRTTYVVLDKKSFGDGYFFSRERLAAAERITVHAYTARGNELPNTSPDCFDAAAPHNVRLCFHTPGMPVVPIDDASIPNKRSRRHAFPNLLRLPRLRTVSGIPLLTVLFGVGSAGVAFAKGPGIESVTQIEAGASRSSQSVSIRDATSDLRSALDDRAMLSLAASDPFPGGPGLHLFWRDPVHGAVEQTVAPSQTVQGARNSEQGTNPVAGIDEAVRPDQFRDAANSGATFGVLERAQEPRVDLGWAAEGERAKLDLYPITQSGVAALLGLSRLARSDSSDDAYRMELEDLRLHFGSSRSLEVQARLHSAAARPSSGLHRSGDSSERTILVPDNKREAQCYDLGPPRGWWCLPGTSSS
jgi:hypothetical protein